MGRASTRAIVFASFLGITDASSAEFTILLDRGTRDYLEGEWAITSGPSSHKAACAADGAEETYAIEFQKTGGSVLIVDDVDADFRVPIFEASKSGNIVKLVLRDPDGSLFKAIEFTPVRSDLMALRENVGRVPGSAINGFAYRCAGARHTVVGALSPLSAIQLTARSSSGAHLVQRSAVRREESDRQVCARAFRGNYTTLELELIGPSSYGISEWTNDQYTRKWTISGTQLLKDGTILFLTSGNSATLTFTLKRHGKHFEVPELHADFVLCTSHP